MDNSPEGDATPVRRVTMMPFIDAIAHFQARCGQSTAGFNPQQVSLYTGLQLEELGEQMAVIAGGCVMHSERMRLLDLADLLKKWSNEFKEGRHTGDLMRCNHADLIDGQFDLAWVAAAALNSTSIDPVGAIAHGSYTNLDKVREGVPVMKDGNGKVQKPANWKAPNFEPYTDPAFRTPAQD